MVNTLSFITLVVSAASLVVAILVALKLKTVVYLLEQPIVKKMSPQLRLKPVKLDEVMNRGGREGARSEGRPDGRGPRQDGRGPRPERTEGGRPERTEGGRPERREGQREERGPRREGGDRREGGRDGRREDRAPRNDRPERSEGPREERAPRGDRHERSEGQREERGPRREGGDRREGGRPPREFTETRDLAPASPAPSHRENASESAPLSPRRPLVADNTETRSAAAPVRETPVAESFVGSNGDDMQHGRRTQLKKKPRFEIDEETTTSEG